MILFGRNKGGTTPEWQGTRESAASSDDLLRVTTVAYIVQFSSYNHNKLPLHEPAATCRAPLKGILPDPDSYPSAESPWHPTATETKYNFSDDLPKLLITGYLLAGYLLAGYLLAGYLLAGSLPPDTGEVWLTFVHVSGLLSITSTALTSPVPGGREPARCDTDIHPGTTRGRNVGWMPELPHQAGAASGTPRNLTGTPTPEYNLRRSKLLPLPTFAQSPGKCRSVYLVCRPYKMEGSQNEQYVEVIAVRVAVRGLSCVPEDGGDTSAGSYFEIPGHGVPEDGGDTSAGLYFEIPGHGVPEDGGDTSAGSYFEIPDHGVPEHGGDTSAGSYFEIPGHDDADKIREQYNSSYLQTWQRLRPMFNNTVTACPPDTVVSGIM
ncbi:uncharacterized protein BJ212DRAFT_1297911 [Suillus subaureus]|uniref:Uncharacterized protein n=1 Tax=Suillus subaureus TaxID=48587 RepID=A0A9P7EGG3_9AGAM|nr:uncharacterized protein BJ212DRAFT_1297911 [Suillus subaureus]KAG1820538.1 hypothetical protein BJ212DRAFT_1297911 [Suillus subaureus]